MNIILLAGGTSSERNVSLATSRALVKALREANHNVKVIDPLYGAEQPEEKTIFEDHPVIGQEFPSADELKKYSSRKVLECIDSSIFDNTDIVFLGLHGKFGEDGKIQSLLEMRGVPYTGSGVVSSAMAMDKDVTKILLTYACVPTPKWFTVNHRTTEIKQLKEKILKTVGYPAVLKPNDEGSTVGLSIVQPDVEDMQLDNALESAFMYSDKVIVEEFIPGKELTVTVLGDEALPVVEIKPKDGFYDYEHKYTAGKTEYFCPADIPYEKTAALKSAGLTAHRILGCRAYSRVDFRMNDKGNIFCLEVNTLPGMTEFSLVPKSAEAVGISFPRLLERIIELSLM